MPPAAVLPIAPHPDRERVLAELHARPFVALETPARLFHIALASAPEHQTRDAESVAALARARGWPQPTSTRFYASPDGALRWERHGEFVTWTLRSQAGATPWAALTEALGELPAEAALLVAVELVLDRSDPPELPGAIRSTLADGRAEVASDFVAGPDGFVRFHLANRSMDADLAGATVQRLLEVETYRSLALLGLPQAERLAPDLNRIEARLPEVMARIEGVSGLDENQRLLEEISALALALEQASAGSAFRFGATRAYFELVQLRLEALGEAAVAGEVGLSSFLSRRINPAMRTCASIERRMEQLGERLARAGDMLRARIDLALERQNRDLLSAMARRFALQLRLQQTVEGLSVAAVSYYVVGLVYYLAKGWHAAFHGPDPTLAAALAVPPVVLGVAMAVHRIRRLHGARREAQS